MKKLIAAAFGLAGLLCAAVGANAAPQKATPAAPVWDTYSDTWVGGDKASGPFTTLKFCARARTP